MACAVRYFCVALLRRRLSSLERVPAPGAPTPFTTTPCPPFAIFSLPINRNSPVIISSFLFLPPSPNFAFHLSAEVVSLIVPRNVERWRNLETVHFYPLNPLWNRDRPTIVSTNDNYESKNNLLINSYNSELRCIYIHWVIVPSRRSWASREFGGERVFLGKSNKPGKYLSTYLYSNAWKMIDEEGDRF